MGVLSLSLPPLLYLLWLLFSVEAFVKIIMYTLHLRGCFRRQHPSIQLAIRSLDACFRNAVCMSSDRASETVGPCENRINIGCISQTITMKGKMLTLQMEQLITNAFWAAFFCSVALWPCCFFAFAVFSSVFACD